MIAMEVKHIHIHGNSELIVNQVIGTYHVKQLKLSQYKDLVMTILKHFFSYTIDNISCPNYSQNEYHFIVKILCSPIVSDQLEFDSFMCDHIDSEEWFAHIYNYLKNESFPDDSSKSTHVWI